MLPLAIHPPKSTANQLAQVLNDERSLFYLRALIKNILVGTARCKCDGLPVDWKEEVMDMLSSTSAMKGISWLGVTGNKLPNNQRVIVFSPKTYPNMKAAKWQKWASMSIPFFFKPIIVDSGWNVLVVYICFRWYCGWWRFQYELSIDMFDWKDSIGSRIPIYSYTLVSDWTRRNNLSFDQLKTKLALHRGLLVHLENYVGAFYNFIMENLNQSDLTKDDYRHRSISSELVSAKD